MSDWPDLRPYQADMLAAVRDAKSPRVIASMATGLGKGHVAGHLTEALGTNRILYLAHRKELIDQLREHVSRVVGWHDVGVERAEERAGSWQPCVVASVPTLKGARLARMRPERFDAIVTDEAHHATAESYRAIYRHFGALDENDRKVESPRVRLVGLTATPSRGDGVGLSAVFDEIVYQYPVGQGIRDKWLVPVHAFQVATGVVLDVDTDGTRGDYKVGQLAQAVNVDARNATVFDACQKNAKGLRTLVFCADVAHAQAMAAHFRERGVAAEWVAGTMATDMRKATLAWFEATPGAVLCNVAIITEGVDLPGVECVCLARPTRSATLYAQIMGRGTRLARGAKDYDESVKLGKSRMVLLDITDSIADAGKRAVKVGDLFGLPIPDADCAGRDVLEVAEEQQRNLDLAMEAQKVATRARAVDLFAPPTLPDFCKLNWSEFHHGTLSLSAKDYGTVRLQTDVLDRWIVERYDREARRWEPTGDRADTQEEAVALVERQVLALDPGVSRLLGRDAAWQKKQPSILQIASCVEHFIRIPEGTGRGAVSIAMDRHWHQCRCSKGDRVRRLLEWKQKNPALAKQYDAARAQADKRKEAKGKPTWRDRLAAEATP